MSANNPKILETLRLEPPSTEPWSGGDSERAIIVMMSGGVDSSVTALELKRQGWKVLGITMRMPGEDAAKRGAPEHPAQAVSRELGIRHYMVDVREAYESLVVAPFRDAYLAGRTPNPCVLCNGLIKFGAVWDFIEARFGVRHLATGHYARVLHEAEAYYLARGADPRRDQSYFLYWIPARRLGFLHFPLSEWDKERTRETARRHGLGVADARDSMDFCVYAHLGLKGDYRELLGIEPVSARPGPVRDTDGNVIGTHAGIHNYTIGQRKGIPVAAGKPLYVTRIDPGDNAITVGDFEDVHARSVYAEIGNILFPGRFRVGERLAGKLRSMGEPSPCVIATLGENRMSVEFDRPQFAPAPGQHLVLYDERGRLVAGGVIVRAPRPR